MISLGLGTTRSATQMFYKGVDILAI